MKTNFGIDDDKTATESLYNIAEYWADSDRQTWWWKINDLDTANEMFEAAVVELVDVIGISTVESARDARLAAVAMIRANLPGHSFDEMVALEPDNLADAKNMLLFLTASYAELLNYCMPSAQEAEAALTETAHVITQQAIEYAKQHEGDQNND